MMPNFFICSFNYIFLSFLSQMKQHLKRPPLISSLLHLFHLILLLQLLIKQPLLQSLPGRAALLAAVPLVMTATACPLQQMATPQPQQGRKLTPAQSLLWLQQLLLPQKNQALNHHYYPPARAASSMICKSSARHLSGRGRGSPCADTTQTSGWSRAIGCSNQAYCSVFVFTSVCIFLTTTETRTRRLGVCSSVIWHERSSQFSRLVCQTSSFSSFMWGTKYYC